MVWRAKEPVTVSGAKTENYRYSLPRENFIGESHVMLEGSGDGERSAYVD
jgi:hypothetical protein